MKKYYMCDLIQVPKSVGYISPYDSPYELGKETSEIIFNPGTEEFKANNFKRIIVETTLDPFTVKEIKTGFKIPMMYCKKDVQTSEEHRKMFMDWFISYTTFVRSLKVKRPEMPECNEGLVVPKVCEVEDYFDLHPNTEVFLEELSQFFIQGLYNLKNRIDSEAADKFIAKRSNDTIRKLIRENR